MVCSLCQLIHPAGCSPEGVLCVFCGASLDVCVCVSVCESEGEGGWCSCKEIADSVPSPDDYCLPPSAPYVPGCNTIQLAGGGVFANMQSGGNVTNATISVIDANLTENYAGVLVPTRTRRSMSVGSWYAGLCVLQQPANVVSCAVHDLSSLIHKLAVRIVWGPMECCKNRLQSRLFWGPLCIKCVLPA